MNVDKNVVSVPLHIRNIFKGLNDYRAFKTLLLPCIKLAAVISWPAAHLQAPERQTGYCTPMKTVAYNKFTNNTWFQSIVCHSC